MNRFEVMIEENANVGKKPKSACILDIESTNIYMLTLFTILDTKRQVNDFIEQLYEITDLLNSLNERNVSAERKFRLMEYQLNVQDRMLEEYENE